MPKISVSDTWYALRHPLRAARYALFRDRIPYEVCAEYLPVNPIIIEAGAYDGSNTRDFCRFWPDCQVYAFEPVPSAYERLVEVAKEFPLQIHPQPMALSGETGTAEMHVSVTGISGGEQSSSLLPPGATREEFPFVGFREETITVQVTRLDDWSLAHGVSRIDFLWLDLQGMELAALECCGVVLSGVSVIHCEVQNVPLYQGATLYPDIAEWLQRRGFRVAREAIFRRGGNVLFVRRK
jgi:FkbM family methyltransferase